MCTGTGTKKAVEQNKTVTLTPAQLAVVNKALDEAYDRSTCGTFSGILDAQNLFRN